MDRAAVPPVVVRALQNVSGSLRVDDSAGTLGVIHVERGRVWLGQGDGHADAVAVVADKADLERIVKGELNPVVAAIQGRVVLRGNPDLATRIILALNAAKPFGGGGPGAS